MNHIDLFSGIGGFAYAAREVWGAKYNNLFFCDNNKFCQKVLKKNFGKDIIIYDDIRQVTADSEGERFRKERANFRGQKEWASGVDLLTGGFPCQPFSQAGKRKGRDDDRYLWGEMFRVIQLFKSTWVIVENVRGLLTIEGGLVFEQVCLNLESSGYEIQAFIIPACAKDAPHRRDRIWIVANTRCGHGEGAKNPGEFARQIHGQKNAIELERSVSNASDSAVKGLEGKGQEKQPGERGRFTTQDRRKQKSWNENWLEVATKFCRVDDGLPERLYFLKGLVYNSKRGGNDEKCDSKKTESEMDKFIWKEMRKVWSDWLFEQTSSQNGKEKDNDIMRSVPCKRTPKEWHSSNQEAKDLRNLWEKFYASSFEEAQKLFPEMLERIRAIERTKKVGGYTKAGHRAERLKALGNAIVPQIAIEIMKAIKQSR